MNKSSSNTDADNRRLICRLCSNKGSLISLFKGKSRTVRDFIRKIVEVTVGIKYEEDNYFDCICYSCVIETYNIHVFKTKSLKNEERLQALVPNRANKSDSAKKLSDIELPNYTELKPILSIWLQTKTSESSVSTDKSSNEGSSPVCVKSTVDNSTQTRAPKSFNVSVSAAFKPIIPKVTIETQTNLIETINVGTQYNLTKKESSKRPRIKDRYIQCDLLQVKIETKKPKSLFDVYTQTIDLKTENNNEAIITRKCDSDKYSWVHKTLNNKIKNINSDKNKSKKLKDKLKQHKSPKNFDDLFEPLKIDKAAAGLEFSIKKSSSDSTIDSTESKMVDSSCNSIEASDSAQLSDKLVSETLIKCSNEDDSKNVRTRRSLSSKSELKTPPLQVKETLPNIIKTTETKKSERIANKSLLNQSDERATSGLLKTVTSPKVIETGIPIEISSQPNTNRSEDRKVESEYLCTKRKSYLKPETPLNNHLRLKETKSSLNIDTQKSQLKQSIERATSEILKVTEPVTSPIVKETSSQLNKNRSDRKIESEHVRPKRKSYSKIETPSNNRLQMKETLPSNPKSPLNIDSQKSQLNQSVEMATSGILKVIEPVTSPTVKETIITSSQLNKNRLEDSKIESDIHSKRKICKKPETSPNNRLRMKETLPNITKSHLNTDTQKPVRILNKSQLNQSDKKATSGLLKIVEPVSSLKVTETQQSKPGSDNRKVESANVRHTKKLNLKPEFKTSSPKNNHLQIKEALSSFTTDSRKSESISNKTQHNQSDERPTIGLLKVIEPVTSPIIKETDSPIETSFQSNKNSSLPDSSVYNPLTVDCQKSDLLEVKVEQDSPNLIDLDTSIVLKTSPASYDNEPSPNNNDSPNSSSSGLLQKTGKVEYLRTCPECGRIIHTKHEMVEHRKSHMKCYLCKKRFTSIKKTKEHMNNDCVRKLDSTNPVITLMKIEHCQSLTDQYPNVLGQIAQSPKKRRRNHDSEEKGSKKKIVFLPSTSSSK